MLVEPNSFVASMSRHWTDTLGNVPSAALQAVWRQMAATFNRQIENHDRQDRELWQVLQPATGTGKSQGLAVYCSMLPREDHPGVLVVTRLKAQADELAATINRLSGAEVAVPYHTDNRVPVAELAAAPVLVITHKAYENGLDAICRGDPKASSWQRYHEWEGGDRRLVVIDEALDIVEEAFVRYAATLRQGRMAISEVREALSVPKRTMQWLLARLKDGTSDLARNLGSLGISYEVVGAGRGARSYLVKA